MSDTSYVYVLCAGGFYKIGRSNRPVRRLSELVGEARFRYGVRPELIYTIPTSSPRALEHQLHVIFRDWKDQGEWFKLPRNAVIWLCRQTAEIEPAPNFGAIDQDERHAEEELFRPEEVIIRLGIDRATFRKWIRTGYMHYYQLGRGTIRVEGREIQRIEGLTK